MRGKKSELIKKRNVVTTLFPNIDEAEIGNFVRTNSQMDLPHLIAHFLNQSDITGPGKEYLPEISKARVIKANIIKRDQLLNAVSSYKPTQFDKKITEIVMELINKTRFSKKRPCFTVNNELQHIASYIAYMLKNGVESFDSIKIDKYLEIYNGKLENFKSAFALVIKTESTTESINTLINHDFNWRNVILDMNNICGLGCSISLNDAVFMAIITGESKDNS